MPNWSLTPYLVLPNASAAIDFYAKAFNAQEFSRMTTPDGQRVVHAEIRAHGAKIYLSDDFGKAAQMGDRISLHLEVPDADLAMTQAEQAGAQVVLPVQEVFWGARHGRFQDPFGIHWSVSTQIRILSEADMKAAIAEWAEQQQV